MASANATSSASIATLSPYDYLPSQSVGIIFVTLFSISTLVHFIQSIRFRVWWMLPTAVLCGVAELVGWSARLYSSSSPIDILPFEIQISATIVAPTPLIAANFIMLGRIIKALGPQYSRLGPKLYTIIFLSCDIVALTVQGVGGATAAIAVGNGTSPNTGGNIMLIGIGIQLVAITAYVLCATEFLLRYVYDLPLRAPTDQRDADSVNEMSFSSPDNCMNSRMKILICAMTFNTVCLFIRSIYRTVELTDGWTGRIIATQVYFNVLDGGMVTLAIFTYNFFHPGYLLIPSKIASKLNF